jgi:hypothetical protein
MLLSKCDICKKQIDLKHTMSIRASLFESFDLCYNCGKPIMKFLTSKKLVKNVKADKKNGKK